MLPDAARLLFGAFVLICLTNVPLDCVLRGVIDSVLHEEIWAAALKPIILQGICGDLFFHTPFIRELLFVLFVRYI